MKVPLPKKISKISEQYLPPLQAHFEKLHLIRQETLPPIFLIKEKLDALLRVLLSSTSSTIWSTLAYPISPNIRRQRLPHPLFLSPNNTRTTTEDELAKFLNTFLDSPQKTISAHHLASYIAEGYRELNKAWKNHHCVYDPANIQIPNIEPNCLPLAITSMVKTLNCQQTTHSQEILTVLASYADGHFVPGYSDLDVAWVLPKEICQNETLLMQARKRYLKAIPYFYSVDRQQHHEIFIFSEWEFHLRNNTHFPEFLWTQSKLLSGKNEIELSTPILDPAARLLAITQPIIYTLGFLSKPKWKNWYKSKEFLGHLTMLAAHYYQSQGCPIDKSKAIKRLSETPEFTQLFKVISSIRKEWPKHHPQAVPPTWYLQALKLNPQLTRLSSSLRQPTPDWIHSQLIDTIETHAPIFLSYLAKNTLELLKTTLRIEIDTTTN